MTTKSMKKSTALLVVGLLFFPLARAGVQDAAVILEKVDGYRKFAESFTMEVKLLDYEGDALQEEMALFGYFSGDDKSVLVAKSGKNKGMKILMKGDDMWVNLTGSKRGLRITPMQRLMGQAANGDVAKVSFARDYSGKIQKQDDSTIVLELNAKSPGATYQRALLYVNAKNLRPEKAEFFLLSGKHFKTAYYLEYARFENNIGISKMKIVDQLNPKLYTIVESGAYRKAVIPEKYFNVMYLPNIELE